MSRKKRSLFSSSDIARIVKSADVESVADHALIAWAVVILTAKLVLWAGTYPTIFGAIRPDEVLQGIRLLLYRPELEKWRDKHPGETKAANAVAAVGDFWEMVKYLAKNISRMIDLIPK